MNNKKYTKLVTIFSLILTTSFFTACSEDYIDDPDRPSIEYPNQLMNDALYRLMHDTRDEWFSGRLTNGWMEYWGGTFYTSENRYAYRETQSQNGWDDIYRALKNLKTIIDINEDPETKDNNLQYGSNNNQIQMSRILLSYGFLLLTETWGDVPYYSYGNNDADFQALQHLPNQSGTNTPKYASQEKILKDILSELKLASEALSISEGSALSTGDQIYGGDVEQWKKFANSLRLRVAVLIKGIDSTTAQEHFDDAIAAGVFESNADNAGVEFGSDDLTASPMYEAFFVNNRTDFAAAIPFLEILKGYKGPFSTQDPRIAKYFNNAELGNEDTSELSYPYDNDIFIGLPYGAGNSAARAIDGESFPGDAVLIPNYTEYIIEYSEVEFIKSEFNGWDQTSYENGVQASMEKWGVNSGDITTYMSSLPAASAETVATQKYIALYMQPHTAWAEYRRTGYPNTLALPGQTYITEDNIEYPFSPLVSYLTDIPTRLRYPQQEQAVNTTSWEEAISSLSNGDSMDSKLWWDVN